MKEDEYKVEALNSFYIYFFTALTFIGLVVSVYSVQA